MMLSSIKYRILMTVAAVSFAGPQFANAHGLVMKVNGANGVTTSGFGVIKGTARDGVDEQPFQIDTSVFKNLNSNPCGETIGGGSVDIKQNMAAVEKQGGGKLPELDSSMNVDMVIHQVNADGGGPYQAFFNTDATGQKWTQAKVTKQVPGVNGLVSGAPLDSQFQAQLPAGTQCTGGTNGNACLLRVSNGGTANSFANGAGPFGSCLAVQMPSSNNGSNNSGGGANSGNGNGNGNENGNGNGNGAGANSNSGNGNGNGNGANSNSGTGNGANDAGTGTNSNSKSGNKSSRSFAGPKRIDNNSSSTRRRRSSRLIPLTHRGAQPNPNSNPTKIESRKVVWVDDLKARADSIRPSMEVLKRKLFLEKRIKLGKNDITEITTVMNTAMDAVVDSIAGMDPNSAPGGRANIDTSNAAIDIQTSENLKQAVRDAMTAALSALASDGAQADDPSDPDKIVEANASASKAIQAGVLTSTSVVPTAAITGGDVRAEANVNAFGVKTAFGDSALAKDAPTASASLAAGEAVQTGGGGGGKGNGGNSNKGGKGNNNDGGNGDNGN